MGKTWKRRNKQGGHCCRCGAVLSRYNDNDKCYPCIKAERERKLDREERLYFNLDDEDDVAMRLAFSSDGRRGYQAP